MISMSIGQINNSIIGISQNFDTGASFNNKAGQ